MSDRILYRFEQNDEALRVVNTSLGGVQGLKDDIRRLFEALEVAYNTTGGGEAVQVAQRRFGGMLLEALTVSDDIQKKAVNQQQTMAAMDIIHRNRLA